MGILEDLSIDRIWLMKLVGNFLCGFGIVALVTWLSGDVEFLIALKVGAAQSALKFLTILGSKFEVDGQGPATACKDGKHCGEKKGVKHYTRKALATIDLALL